MKHSRTSLGMITLGSLLASAALLTACGHGVPYAELKGRDIKALPAQDIQGLLEGRGMSMALPAEFNSYPGPMHVLAHANALQVQVQTLTQTIGQLQARPRADHLLTHLAKTALLDAQQIARYQSLRGYSA